MPSPIDTMADGGQSNMQSSSEPMRSQMHAWGTLPVFDSPIERLLYEACRAHGLAVATQYDIGRFTVDMIVSNRQVAREVVIECDGSIYHALPLIDDFRDDILEDAGWRIIRFTGSAIVENPERCVVTIYRLAFHELLRSLPYRYACELAFLQENPEYHPDPEADFDYESNVFDSEASYRPTPYRQSRRALRKSIRDSLGPDASLTDLAKHYVKSHCKHPLDVMARLDEYLRVCDSRNSLDVRSFEDGMERFVIALGISIDPDTRKRYYDQVSHLSGELFLLAVNSTLCLWTYHRLPPASFVFREASRIITARFQSLDDWPMLNHD